MDEERIAIVDLADELQIRKQRTFKIRVRFKVGFTMELDGRLQKHRCSAPFAAYVKQWPCLRAWERTAIDCVTAACEQLHTEVFRARDLDEIVGRADRFFALMPTVRLPDDDDDQTDNGVR
jgi:hypothetical protein